MRWLIFALGVVLALSGATSIVSGVPYIRMEFGWTEVIAGTTAVSGGIITLALAAVLGALRRLEMRFAENTSSAMRDIPDVAGHAAEDTPAFGTDPVGDGLNFAGHEPDVPVATAVERDVPSLPATRPIAERIWTKPSSKAPLGNDRAQPSVPAEPSRSTDRPPGVRPAASAATLDRDPRRQPELGQLGAAPPRSYVRPVAASLTRGDADDRVPSLIPSPQPPVTAEAAPLEAPTVVGRYESGGASYVLFSDGTIEVETEVGLHRFGSMEELKAYIDKQQTSGIG